MTLSCFLCDSKCNGKKKNLYPTIIINTTGKMEQIEKNTELKPSVFLKCFAIWLSFQESFSFVINKL